MSSLEISSLPYYFSCLFEVCLSLTAFQKFSLLKSQPLKFFPDPPLLSCPCFLSNYDHHHLTIKFKVLISFPSALKIMLKFNLIVSYTEAISQTILSPLKGLVYGKVKKKYICMWHLYFAFAMYLKSPGTVLRTFSEFPCFTLTTTLWSRHFCHQLHFILRDLRFRVR